MTLPTVAIVKSDFHDNHTSAWGQVWINYCKEQNIKFDLIDWRSLEPLKSSHPMILLCGTIVIILQMKCF